MPLCFFVCYGYQFFESWNYCFCNTTYYETKNYCFPLFSFFLLYLSQKIHIYNQYMQSNDIFGLLIYIWNFVLIYSSLIIIAPVSLLKGWPGFFSRYSNHYSLATAKSIMLLCHLPHYWRIGYFTSLQYDEKRWHVLPSVFSKRSGSVMRLQESTLPYCAVYEDMHGQSARAWEKMNFKDLTLVEKYYISHFKKCKENYSGGGNHQLPTPIGKK